MRKVVGTADGFAVSGLVSKHGDQILSLHGDGFDGTKNSVLGNTLRRIRSTSNVGISDFLDGLYETGYSVQWPWTGSCWGMQSADVYNVGALGLKVIDKIFPTGPVHVIGSSMGGFHNLCWSSAHVGRVASMVLVSPAVDLLAIYDGMKGNALLGGIADEIMTARCGSSTADRSLLVSSIVDAHQTPADFVSLLSPIADKIFVVCCTDDPLVLPSTVQDFATALDLPPERAVLFPSGSETNRHPAPYRPELGWDPLTTLRIVEANS